MFVQITLRIVLLLSRFRANMSLPKGKSTKTEEHKMKTTNTNKVGTYRFIIAWAMAH